MPNGYDSLFVKLGKIQDLLEYCESLTRTQKDMLSTLDSAKFADFDLYGRLTNLLRETQAFEKQLEIEYHKSDKELNEVRKIEHGGYVQLLDLWFINLENKLSVLGSNMSSSGARADQAN